MNITAITNYPYSIKSYLTDKAKNSVFNSPIVKTTFVASTVLFTGIAAVYLVKKTKEAIRSSLDKPVQTFCIAGAIFATGAVIAYHPVMSMILFVGLSYILLNKNLYSKISNMHQVASDFFNSPFKTLGNFSFKANNPKLIQIDNTSSIIKALEQLNFQELEFRVPQLEKDDENSNDNTLPITTAMKQLNFEELNFITSSLLGDDVSSIDNLLATPIIEEQIDLENQKLDSSQPQEDEACSIDNTVPTPKVVEVINIEELDSTTSQSQEDEARSIDNTAPIAKAVEESDIEELDSTTSEPSEDVVRSNDNSSLLEIAKTMKVKQFNFSGINLENLNLGNLQTGEDDVNLTNSPLAINLPKFSIQTISPSSKPPGTSSNNKPFGTGNTHNRFQGKNIDPSANKLIKSYGKVLKLVRILPK